MFHASFRRLFSAATIMALAATLSPTMAAAQGEGQNAMERAVVLGGPAVVFIDTSVKVKVVLVYQNPDAVSGLGSLRRSYSFDYATGSGFVVNPNGAIVTASHVVEPEQQRIRNYAANRLVLEGYGYNYPDGGSPFDQYDLPLGYQNVLLQQCYRAVACTFTITPIVTVFTPVDIAQTQLPVGSPARVLTSTGFDATDVAILQTNGTNMPTVPLASTAMDLQSGDEITALGFPGSSRDNLETGVTQPNKVFGNVSNIRPEGTSSLIEVDANIEPGMSGGPAVDGDGDVVGLISFALLQSSGESGAKYLRTVDDIKTAMAAAGVEASRGPADSAFEAAMDAFWNRHYSASVPLFEKVLALSSGNLAAKGYLADAQSKAGTAQDIPVATPSKAGLPVWVIAAAGGGALLILLLLVLVVRRKRPAPAAAMPTPLMGNAVPPAAEPDGHGLRVVGFQPTPAPASAPAPQPSVTGPVGTPTMPGSPSGVAVADAPASSVQAAHFCSECGHSLGSDPRFCPGCGHHVNG